MSKLSDAETEAAETQVWLQFALQCGYLTEDVAAPLHQEFDQITGLLVLLSRNAKAWSFK